MPEPWSDRIVRHGRPLPPPECRDKIVAALTRLLATPDVAHRVARGLRDTPGDDRRPAERHNLR